MRDPNILSTYGLFSPLHPQQSVTLFGVERWIPARPLPYGGFRNRFRAAWLVFTGRADALIWEAGDHA